VRFTGFFYKKKKKKLKIRFQSSQKIKKRKPGDVTWFYFTEQEPRDPQARVRSPVVGPLKAFLMQLGSTKAIQ